MDASQSQSGRLKLMITLSYLRSAYMQCVSISMHDALKYRPAASEQLICRSLVILLTRQIAEVAANPPSRVMKTLQEALATNASSQIRTRLFSTRLGSKSQSGIDSCRSATCRKITSAATNECRRLPKTARKSLILCVSILGHAAATAALAERQAHVSVSCPTGFNMAQPLCHAFLEGLSKHYPTAEICLAATPHGVIRLHAAQRGTSGMEAQVFWTDAQGKDSGPLLELDLADTALSGAMMPDFVRWVIQRSNLPHIGALTRDDAPSDLSTQERSSCDT